jgi:hypothetical protein
MFRKWDVEVWTGSSWLRIRKGGRHLWMLLWIFGFHEMRGIFDQLKTGQLLKKDSAPWSR